MWVESNTIIISLELFLLSPVLHNNNLSWIIFYYPLSCTIIISLELFFTISPVQHNILSPYPPWNWSGRDYLPSCTSLTSYTTPMPSFINIGLSVKELGLWELWTDERTDRWTDHSFVTYTRFGFVFIGVSVRTCDTLLYCTDPGLELLFCVSL